MSKAALSALSQARPIRTIEATLPSSERFVKFREPSGQMEIASLEDAAPYSDLARANVGHWSLMMRCCVDLGGAGIDQTKMTPEHFRDLFDATDWMFARDLFFEAFMLTTKAQRDAFDSSKRAGTL